MKKWLKKIFCRHRNETKVVLAGGLAAELTADRCTRCGRLRNVEWEY